MTRDEFLRQLKEALENDLQGQIVQDNVNYYNQYISEEVRKGIAEQDVIDSLGDPWILAKTVIDSVSGTKYTEHIYEAEESRNKQKQGKESFTSKKAYTFDTWWKRWLLYGGIFLIALAIIGVLFLAIVVVGGILAQLLPVILMVIVGIKVAQFVSKR
jgi:Predicted membrane protein